MNKHRRIYVRPVHDPLLADADAPTAPITDASAGAPREVRVEVPQLTTFEELSDTEWSAFMGLRGGTAS